MMPSSTFSRSPHHTSLLSTRTCRARRTVATRAAADAPPDKGLSILEWTGGLVPQGLLVTGAKEGWKAAWQTMVKELAPQSRDGAYKRPGYTFRTSDTVGMAAPARLHVYVGNACPWCHRVLLAVALLGLGGRVGITHLQDVPEKARRGGWVMPAPDPVFQASDLWQVYNTLSHGFRGRCTAPLVVNPSTRRPVSNESADIVRYLDSVFVGGGGAPGASGVQLYPAQLAAQIDALESQIYTTINNGVYVAGFSTSQAAYDAAVTALHASLAQMDSRLEDTRFLMGDRFTEADLYLFPTIVRFDAVYAGLFKCGRRRIADYPHLHAWLRDVWAIKVPGGGLQVSDTVDVDACRSSYYRNLFPLNPGGIIPSGPTAADLQLQQPAGRGGYDMDQLFFMR